MNQHIQNIEISNFKSIKDLKVIDLNEINIIVGPPNSGKSNLLEAVSLFSLPYLDISENTKLNNFIRYQNLGDLVFNQNMTNTDSYVSRTINGEEDKFLLKYDFKGNFPLLNIIRQKDKEFLFHIDYKSQIRQTGNYFSYYSFVKEDTNYTIEYPTLKYFYDGKDHDSVFWNKRLMPFFGENLGMMVLQIKELQEFVANEFEKLGLDLVINKQTGEISAQRKQSDFLVTSVPFTVLADTFRRILFYKAAILSNEESVLLFEEPEAYCYEPYILEFTKEIIHNKNKNQFFIVTHSDFIINELVNDLETKEKINIYLTNFSKERGTEVKLLKKYKEDVYDYGMSVFMNFESLWEEN
ncbi:AAA family ATPase [Chryseobacterium sp. MYb264]|uniref:AAA family ATPase n=1 Tax=Chryseobacterium sp. MYb264 TaxID=2745153 RepID=UPI002E1331D1|nr:AAA family ATPase [Chryseobacterium sp. MYb264]